MLTEGVVYEYDLQFVIEGKPMTLGEATTGKATPKAKLSYLLSGKPSFALPPKDPNLLRLIQGSCRMPHGEGEDEHLSIIDDLIAETASNAFARPHQLLLTGDQSLRRRRCRHVVADVDRRGRHAAGMD